MKSNGHWSITDEGEQALATYPDSGDLIREAGGLYRKWKKAAAIGEAEGEIEDVDALEWPSTTLEEAVEAAWEAIASYVSSMNPSDVESLVVALMEGMGYHVRWRATGGPDGGIDLIAHNDPLGTTNPRIKVQVKRKHDAVGAETRAFLGVLFQGDVGIFVSTGGFINEAVRLARDETRKIPVLNLRALFDLWVDDRIPEEQRKLLPLTRVHFLTPDE